MLANPATTLRRAVIKFGDFWGLEREFAAGIMEGLYSPPSWLGVPASLVIAVAYAVVALLFAAGVWLAAPEWRIHLLLLLPVVSHHGRAHHCFRTLAIPRSAGPDHGALRGGVADAGADVGSAQQEVGRGWRPALDGVARRHLGAAGVRGRRRVGSRRSSGMAVSEQRALGVRNPVDPTGRVYGVLFDVDGTLYRQEPLRRLMALHLLAWMLRAPIAAPRRIKALSVYRRAHESLRRTGRQGIAAAQIEAAAVATRLSAIRSGHWSRSGCTNAR